MEKRKWLEKKRSMSCKETRSGSLEEDEDDPTPIILPVKRKLFDYKKGRPSQSKKKSDSESSSSSESNSQLEYAQSAESSEEFSSSEEEENIKIRVDTKEGDYLLVKVHPNKGTNVRYYIGRVRVSWKKKPCLDLVILNFGWNVFRLNSYTNLGDAMWLGWRK